jgi:hypothetical protein
VGVDRIGWRLEKKGSEKAAIRGKRSEAANCLGGVRFSRRRWAPVGHDLFLQPTGDGSLRAKAKLDTRKYGAGVEVTKAEFRKLASHLHTFHGEWNCERQPRNLTRQLRSNA